MIAFDVVQSPPLEHSPAQLVLFPLVDRWAQRWTVQSETSAEEYVVAVDREGVWGCSCPGWVYQAKAPAKRRQCKHIAAHRPFVAGGS